MVHADRLKERMQAAGLSQAELARRVGVRQPTIFKLTTGGGYGSKHLHRIARELGTTPAYLTGETDDPDEGAPPPPPKTPVQVMLPVTLPSENALADMFEGLLLAIDRQQPLDAVARELAQLLPTGLSTLQGRLFELPRPPRAPGPPAFPAPAAPAATEVPAPVAPEFQR